MKITKEISLLDFEPWQGAVDTKEVIIENNKVEDFDFIVEDLFPNGMTETQLNDLLWFDYELVFEWLNIDND